MNIFMVGLRNSLRSDVELEHRATLEDAMALARIYEQRMAMSGDSPPRTASNRALSY
jgi:hypothetical protein